MCPLCFQLSRCHLLLGKEILTEVNMTDSTIPRKASLPSILRPVTRDLKESLSLDTRSSIDDKNWQCIPRYKSLEEEGGEGQRQGRGRKEGGGEGGGS